MQQELKAEGVDVAIVVINEIKAATEQFQGNLLIRADYPLLQDTAADSAWAKFEGAKDDMYLYGKDGKLVKYLPSHGGATTDLSTPDGYALVKNAIVAAAK